MNHIVPEFQKFISERKLAPANQIPFYARWAGRFIRVSNVRHVKLIDSNIQSFLDDLRKDAKSRTGSLSRPKPPSTCIST